MSEKRIVSDKVGARTYALSKAAPDPNRVGLARLIRGMDAKLDRAEKLMSKVERTLAAK